MDNINPDSWLNLGIPGAALFIILVVVMLMFNQQSKSIIRLCDKIDDIVSNFSSNNTKLNEVIINNDRDQKELIRMLGDVHNELSNMHSRVVRIDSRMFDFINNEERSQPNESKETTSDKE